MKANKFTLVKHLSIGLGLALSFGNVIAVESSFADEQRSCSQRRRGECYSVPHSHTYIFTIPQGQTVNSNQSSSPVPSQSKATVSVYCSEFVTQNCVPKTEPRSSGSSDASEKQRQEVQGQPNNPK